MSKMSSIDHFVMAMGRKAGNIADIAKRGKKAMPKEVVQKRAKAKTAPPDVPKVKIPPKPIEHAPAQTVKRGVLSL